MIGNFLWEYKLLYFLKILLLVATDSLRLKCLVTTFWLYRYSKKILDRGFAYRYKNAHGAVTTEFSCNSSRFSTGPCNSNLESEKGCSANVE